MVVGFRSSSRCSTWCCTSTIPARWPSKRAASALTISSCTSTSSLVFVRVRLADESQDHVTRSLRYFTIRSGRDPGAVHEQSGRGQQHCLGASGASATSASQVLRSAHLLKSYHFQFHDELGLTPLASSLWSKIIQPLVIGPARSNALQKPVLVICEFYSVYPDLLPSRMTRS